MTKTGILRGFSVYVYIYKGTVKNCLKVGQVTNSHSGPRYSISDWKVSLATDCISAGTTAAEPLAASAHTLPPAPPPQT